MDVQVITPIGGIKLGLGNNSPIGETKPGDITPIPDAACNPKIIDLARWAVDEYNKENKTSLKFMNVICAAKQEVSGTMYYITLDAVNGCLMGVYEAKVWVQPCSNSKKLVEFKHIRPFTGEETTSTDSAKMLVSSPNSTFSSLSGKRSEREENDGEGAPSSLEMDDGGGNAATRKKQWGSNKQWSWEVTGFAY
ncbi:hypothetical protein BUALT_Bualt02G0173300 [Buddleja alternifolia]|uniref:Cysteine proteinase inhibitor n=1 Tax=Buddleja alternifolia TaxID=168488 RepID=A0AAV6Y274_9LAMI|nr:hypothetical protein BUALT_Bualt02G0173300 [Buddleja alternifolia]